MNIIHYSHYSIFIVHQASFEADAGQLGLSKRVVDFVLKKIKEKAKEKQKAG